MQPGPGSGSGAAPAAGGVVTRVRALHTFEPTEAGELAFEKGDVQSLGRARALADDIFGAGWQEKGAGVYEEGAEKAQVWGIGHCHIDTAW